MDLKEEILAEVHSLGDIRIGVYGSKETSRCIDNHNILSVVFIDDVTATIMLNYPESNSIAMIKHHQNKWVLHCDDGPAMVYGGDTKIFFNNGINVKIEELPIDDETKTMLMLKYEHVRKDSYMWYR